MAGFEKLSFITFGFSLKVELAPVHCEVRMLLETGKGFDSSEVAIEKAMKAKEKREKKAAGA